jgi:hypothetical protein
MKKIYPYQDCCKQTAVNAFKQRLFYPVYCDSCGNFFAITDQLAFFIKQGIAFYRIKAIAANFDMVLYDGNIIFMLH